MKISVYITSYNQKEYLKCAIESVINQSVKPFEIIVVDDCSTDGSQEMILEFSKVYPIIRYVFHEQNKGVAQVRITALKEVKGDYVTYLDGDDLYLPNKLQIESEIIRKEKVDIAFSNNLYVEENDITKIRWIWAANPISVKMNNQDFFIKTITRDFPRDSLYRMELIKYAKLKEVGFHDVNLKIYEDYDLRIRLAQTCSIGYTLEPTSKIRISNQGLSKSSIDIHRDSFKYIMNKYSDDIERLNSKSSIRINEILSNYVKKFTGPIDRPASPLFSKEKLKQKLIRLITKI